MVIVITIFAVSLGLFTLYSQTSQVRSDLNSQRDVFVSYLRLAQSDSASGKDSESHGIHLAESYYAVFVGDAYVEGGSGNISIELPDSLIFTNINLNGGGEDIIFDSPFGETDEYGTVDLFSEQTNKTSQITINSLGLINF